MSGIEVMHISKSMAGKKKSKEVIYDDFSLSVGKNEIVGLFGPNGCGKTTLFNMIAGIIKPDAGKVLISEEKPGVTNTSYIFQDYRNSLYPWMTVRENLVLPLVIRKMKPKQITIKLERLLEFIKIPFSLEKYPYELSGGQQQYLTILRGLICEPSAMLIDEPFSAIDYNNTLWMIQKLKEILKEVEIPVIIAAHNLNHLMLISKKIYYLSEKPTTIIGEKEMIE